jgi:hypothetical protein
MTVLRILWASPASLIGCALGLVGLVTGGGVRRMGHVLEFWGGGISLLLRQAPLARGASAMTLGHVILGQTQATLDMARSHERVHVHQYERWGPVFIPAYLLCSLVLWARGRNAYLDNPFEQEAYKRSR